MSVTASSLLSDLEKSAFAGDPTARMVLEHPITNILLKELIESPWPSYMRMTAYFDKGNLFKDGSRRLIGGYASVEVIDKQNELITIPALQNALAKMVAAGEKYANLNLEHSNITLGKILLSEHYKDAAGVDHFTHVDEKGLYVLCELREDLDIANKVWDMSNKGELNAFSIGGRCLKRRPVAKSSIGSYWQIDDLELYEVTICKRGKNTLSGFHVLKGYFDNGLIDEATYIAKSEELKKGERLVKELSILPNILGKTFILRENFVSQVDNLAKGEGNTIDLIVKMDQNNPLRRHLQTQFSKAIPAESWPDLGYVFGADAENYPDAKPAFHLALIPAGVAKSVESLQTGSPVEMLRDAIKAEYGAINLYEQMASKTTNEDIKKVLLDVAAEEKVHVGEFQKALTFLDPAAYPALEAGAKELTGQPIAEKAEAAPVATVAAVDGALTLIDQKTEGHRTKPAEYKDVPDSEFADPVNFKYPLDESHVQAAWSYLNVDGNRTAGGYSESEWSQMKEKTKAAMQKFGHEVTEKAVDSSVDGDVDRTLKNVVDREAAKEDQQMSTKPIEVKKELVGNGTGPQQGAITGTSTTGPAIASRKTRVAKMEELLKAANIPVPAEDEDKVPAFAEAKEAAVAAPPIAEQKEAAVAAPLPEQKEAATACPEPDADDKEAAVDEPTLKSLLELDAAGKLPAAMHSQVMKMAEKAKITKSDIRVASIEKQVNTLTGLVSELTNIVKAIKVPTAAEISQDLIAKSGSTIRKSASGPAGIQEPAGTAPATPVQGPTNLQQMHTMSFSQVHELNERRAAMARQGAA
jgi:rubrerythrin